MRSFTAPEDLPNDVVRDVIMTRDDSVWIATWGGGLVVMNGTEKRYINEKNGLISNDVRALEEDREGRVWVGTSDGISCIQDQEIINFSTSSSLHIPVSNSVFSIEVIHNGEVWFGDGLGNLFAWIPSAHSSAVQNGHWKYIYNFKNHLFNAVSDECSIRKILQTDDHSLWLAINNVGMVKIDSVIDFNIDIVRTDLDRSFCFDLLVVDSTQQYLMGYRGLNRIVQLKSEWGNFAPAHCKCLAWALGVLLVGTEQGLYYLDNYQFLPFPLTQNNRLYCIESLSTLRDGSLWIGTRNGVFRISQTSWVPQDFTSQNLSIFQENFDPAFKQKALALDEGGCLWAYRDHAWKTIYRFDQTFYISDTLYARSHQLLIGNATDSIVFDVSQMKIVDCFQVPNDYTGKYQPYITEKQELWYSSSEGVFRKHGEDFIPVFEIPPEIKPDVFSILHVEPDTYWIGGKGWLGCYQGDQFKIVELPPALQNDNAANIRLMQTLEGELWISQLGHGILRYKDSQWYRDNVENGLPSNYIMSLKQSHDGTIWAGDRNNGVMSFKEGRWIRYDDDDGIPLGTVTTIIEDEDGGIWIGVYRQDVGKPKYYIEVMKYQPDPHPPAVRILSASTRLLPESPGIFSFQGYDTWKSTPREQLVYSWRVREKTQNAMIHEWQPYSYDTSAMIPKLPPGEYIFEVRTQDRYRNTSAPNSAEFVVDPYFWMNRYFQIPVALAVFFATLSLYINRKRYKQTMENRLLKEKMDFMTFCDISKIGLLRLSLEGEIRFVNQAMATICGFENERQMMEYSFPLQWKRPEHFDHFIQAIARPESHGHVQLMGLQPLSAKEYYVFLYGNHKNDYLEIVALDVTPQMAVEQIVLHAQVEQQQKISQDLHDGVVQDLTGISNKVQVLLAKNADIPILNIRDIEILNQIVENSCQKLRQISMGFSPIDFSEIDLAMALEEIRYDLVRAYPGPDYQFQIQPEIPCLEETIQDHIYHIIHEALFNAAKHSRANCITLTTETRNDQLIFVVQDNGIGFSRPLKSSGLGLTTMQRRSDLIGAELIIDLHPEGGTVVQCLYSLPK